MNKFNMSLIYFTLDIFIGLWGVSIAIDFFTPDLEQNLISGTIVFLLSAGRLNYALSWLAEVTRNKKQELKQ